MKDKFDENIVILLELSGMLKELCTSVESICEKMIESCANTCNNIPQEDYE